MAITIAVDAMGGDVGVAVTVPAVLDFLAEQTDVEVILVGLSDQIEAELQKHKASHRDRLRIQAASQVVAMDEPPASALKNKKDSSMRVAAALVKDGSAQACVSAGNTGALMAVSRFVLKTIPGIDRPAIAKVMPTMKGRTCVLDLGANVDCSAEHLLQFAIMGSALVQATWGPERPTVGLLNIGSEAIKGNEIVKEAGELLRASELNFFGNIEGNDICEGTVDVVVCDGFTGNVALKTIEGLAHMVRAFLTEEFKRSWLSRLVGLIAMPVLGKFKRRVDSRRYNGASLLGLRGVVIKSHGGTDRFGFQCALDRALEEARGGIIARIEAQVSRQLAKAPVDDAA